MKIVSGVSGLKDIGIVSAAVAAGVFDGVHKGHKKVISEAIRIAEKINAVPVALTFYPHPRSVIEGASAPRLIIPRDEKLALLEEAGLEAAVEMPFTKEFAAMSPHEFLSGIFDGGGDVRIKAFCSGSGWRFGNMASGSAVDIAEKAKSGKFIFSAVDEEYLDGKPVSSTRIRKAVSETDFQLAGEMLGRPYSITGTVARGMQMAAPVLGVPTANLNLPDTLLTPPFGVYSANVYFDDYCGKAAVFTGVAPTVRGSEKHPQIKAEAHIFNFNGNLYGKVLKIEFLKFIRPQIKFSGSDELKKQITEDLAVCLNLM